MYSQKVDTVDRYIEVTRKIACIVCCLLILFFICTTTFANANVTILKNHSSKYDAYQFDDGTIIEGASCSSVFGRIALRVLYLSSGSEFALLSSTGVFKLSDYDPSTCKGVFRLLYNGMSQMSFLGTCLSLLFSLISILENVTDLGRGATMEFYIKSLLKLFATVFIITIGPETCASLISISNEIVDIVTNAMKGISSGSASGLDAELIEKMRDVVDGNVFVVLSYVIEEIIPCIVMLLCFVMCTAMLFSRLISLGVLIVFFPIGVSTFASDGLRGSGFRYIKQFLGVCCRSAAYYLILCISVTMMQSNSIFSMFGGTEGKMSAAFWASEGLIIMQVIIAITTLGCMRRADSLLRDIFA